MPPNSTFVQYGASADEGQVLPANVVARKPGVGSWTSDTQYQGDNYSLRNVYRCTAGEGCTEMVSTRLLTERGWVAESAKRYLMFNFNGSTVKIDPHGVASVDGVSYSEYGGCPSGYGFYHAPSQTCQEPNPDEGRIAQESDGICAYVYDQTGKRFVIDPANYLEHGNPGQHTYLTDPDCYGKPQTSTSIEMGQGGHTATLEALASGHVSIRESKVDSDNKLITTEYVLAPDGGNMKLDGGSYNNVLNPGGGTGDGSPGAGTGPGSGDSGGSCGGPGQSACEIDDSGFAGADAGTGLDDALSAIDARSDALGDFADSDIGVGWDWLPSLMPGAQLECTALVFEPAITHGPAAGLGGSYELDICDKLGVVREIIGWLFGLFTVFYVWRKFANSNGGMS